MSVTGEKFPAKGENLGLLSIVRKSDFSDLGLLVLILGIRTFSKLLTGVNVPNVMGQMDVIL